MPFLRVLRDKRGYETTYLMHWYREGNRQRSRTLYIFRSPGGVRVGREPLQPEVLRELETFHPEINFDWKTVIDNRQVVDIAPDPRRSRKRRRSEDGDASTAKVVTSRPPRPRPREKPDAAALPQPPIPSVIEGSTPDERIAFLTLWYPIVHSRIPQRTSDSARRKALLALAEHLNTAAWTDADQIVVGLQQAAESLGYLSRVFLRRHRRSRRTPTRSTSSGSKVSGPEPLKDADRPTQSEHAPAVAITDTPPVEE